MAVVQAPISIEDVWETEPARKISFYCCLAALFLRLSVLPEIVYYVIHVNTYLLYLVAPLAIVSTLIKGGVQRTFRSRASFYWMAFFLWMALCTPFSSWPGGSAAIVFTYARVNIVYLVLVGGMALNWKEVRVIFGTVAAAALVNLASTRIFAHMSEGRMSMDSSGTIGNSNDLSAQLLLVLPFLMFFMIGRGRWKIARIAIFGLLFYGIWIILATASRGALIGLVAAFLCLVIRASLPQKLLLVVVAGLIAFSAMTVLPHQTLDRLGSLFGEKHQEADESAASRKYLFRTSVKYTFEHPIFGVGPDQFSMFEGKTSVAQGLHGNWHAAHCAYTQVSSECGIPGFLFFIGGLGSSLLLVLRTYRQAKREGFPEIANGCFCYLMGMIGYLVAMIFLPQAYTFKLPAMVGLAVTMHYAAMRTMRAGQSGQVATPLVPVPQRAIRR